MIRIAENLCVPELIQQQVAQSPDAIAVRFETQQLTYRQLDDRANQLAHYLQAQGVQAETLVGVCVDRSVEMLVALLAIMKAGGAYIPIDPSYPADRIAFMLEDSQLAVLVTQSALRDQLPPTKAKLIDLVQDAAAIAQQSTQTPTNPATPDNLAYVIYTSGSTGNPKGVQILHSAVVNFLRSMQVAPGIASNDVLLAITTISFDIAVLELFLPLTVGAQIVLADRAAVSDAMQLKRLFEQAQPTMMQATPATWRMLLAVNWAGKPDLKILSGGEAITQSLAAQLLPRSAALWNMYGPTETTIWSTIQQIHTADAPIAIGLPIANTQVYLLNEPSQRQDDVLTQVPPGEAGELYIGGDGLARGYLHRPDLTADRFVANPFSDIPGDRLYRTGDLARYLPDRTLQCMGRVDHQVKIRGHRIELGDIEAALSQSPLVRDAAVVVHEDESGEKNLVAYVTENADVSAIDPVLASAVQQDVAQQWAQIWDSAYTQEGDDQAATFNLSGWNSSYTGQQAPAAELSQWLDHTIDRITELQPRQILEIGCGMGLLLFQLAPDCERYVGTDISLEAIQYLQQTIAQELPEQTHIELFQHPADTLHELPIGKFDTIVINSVVQYFPDADYLVQVLKSAAQLLAPGGRIFVGDVRSLPLLEAFHTSVQLYQAPDTLPADKLTQRIQQHMMQERELIFDPTFFDLLQTAVPEIAQVQIQLKRGTYQNEFVQFRYDVVLYGASDDQNTTTPIELDWPTQPLSVSEIRQRLQETAPELLAIRQISNARILKELQAIALLASQSADFTVGDLRKMLLEQPSTEGLEPEAIWALTTHLPYDIVLDWSDSSGSGQFDAWFKRRAADAEPAVFPIPKTDDRPSVVDHRPAAASAKLADYVNHPLQASGALNLVAQLRSWLKAKLPDYMVPSIFVELATLPLTPNGKVDRRALPAPSQTRPNLREAYVAPRHALEDQLVTLWEDLLKVAPIGIHDNFFELGGHSLLVAQLMTRLKTQFNVEIALTHLFQAPTIAAYAQVIVARQPLNGEAIEPEVTLDLELEAILDQAINAENADPAIQTAPQHILLTGATGFLGAFLLDELLRQTTAQIYCLTRGATIAQAKQKLLDNLDRFALSAVGQESRIVPLLGDLAQPSLGLTPSEFAMLVSTIDVIYHNGALVNLIYPYTAMRAANVVGTQTILQLASQQRLKPVHFVSTLDVFHSPAYADVPSLLENDPLRHWHGLKNGYAQSKWVAERLVMAAHDRGIPTCIYRIGMITSHSQTGVGKSDDLVGRMIKGFIQMGGAPAIDLSLSFTPVDYVSQAIVQLSQQPALWGQAFHLVTPHVLPLAQLVEGLNAAGYPLQPLPYELWIELLFSPSTDASNALTPFKSLFTAAAAAQGDSYLEALSLQRVGMQNVQSGLTGSGITCPPVAAPEIERYLAYLRQVGWLAMPAAPIEPLGRSADAVAAVGSGSV
jgi:amino acid adenylation domain-containing protein/thioester reductase-like protein